MPVPLRLDPQVHIIFLSLIRREGQEFEGHIISGGTSRLSINVLVEREFPTAGAELLCYENVTVDNFRNALGCRGIGYAGLIDTPLDFLLLFSQKAVVFIRPRHIVLAHQPFQRGNHAPTLVDSIDIDRVGHKNGDILLVRRNISLTKSITPWTYYA